MSYKNVSYLYPTRDEIFDTNNCMNKNNFKNFTVSTILRTYILQDYGLWFILHMKINAKTGKIHHKIRHLNRKNKKEFEYKILFMKDNNIYSVIGQTEALNDSMNLQEEPKTITKIVNNQFYNFENIRFAIDIEEIEPLQWLSNFTAACKNVDKSCIYVDHPNKCLKHEKYFCPYYTTCQLCGLSMIGGELISHFESKHSDVTQRSRSIWRPDFTRNNYKLSVLTFAQENVVCEYKFDDNGFSLFVYTPLKNEELKNYQCEISFTNVVTKNTFSYVLDPEQKEIYDWRTEVRKEDISMFQEKFDVCVDISKIDLNESKAIISKRIRKYSEYSKPKLFKGRKSLFS